MQYRGELEMQQTRQRDEQRMFEQLSSQARNVVAHHEQATRARDERQAESQEAEQPEHWHMWAN